jgi:hypothetical protein
VVTPLGLYEETAIGGPEVANFSYVRDTSAYFDGTSPRGIYKPSRVCLYDREYAPCPFTNDVAIYSANSTLGFVKFPGGRNLTTDVPSILREIYSSGTHGIGTTVSNFFDIEWRQLTVRTDDRRIRNNGSAYPVSMFRQLDSVALDDSVRLVEGLIVDTRSGGIGFRNHTVPQPPDRNVTWQEDLLFIEPVTTCVDTNLTLDYTLTKRNYTSQSQAPPDYRMTDRGGFVNLNHTYPYFDMDNPQANPDLWGRAYKAAVMHNAFTMMYFNVTNPANNETGVKAFQYVDSAMDKSFPLDADYSNDFRAARFTSRFGSYVFTANDDLRYPNPHNVTDSDWFRTIRTSPFPTIPHPFPLLTLPPPGVICAGAGGGDMANITNIFVTCGLVTGPPRRVDGGPQGIFELGSKWSSPLYSCATAVRATIKTVSFTTDPGTSTANNPSPDSSNRGLASLRVTNITAKSYPSPDAYPLWGVEDTGRQLNEIRPIWGLVSPAYPAANFPNMSFVKQPSLYLIGLGSGDAGPTFSPSPDFNAGEQNLAGTDFPFAAANTIYSDFKGITDDSWPYDLVGRADMAVFTRWQGLCKTAEGAGKMINLLWTDLAASAVVGTKGIAQSQNGEGEPAPVIHVRPTVRRTRYHFPYGIPAFLLLAVLVGLTVGALCAWLSRMSTIERVRTRIQQLSAGRIFTIVLYPGESDFRMTPKEWSLMSGGKTVRFADGDHGINEGEQDNLNRDLGEEVQTPATSFADVVSEGKTEDLMHVGSLQVYEGGQQQHGGYIALDPVSYESR